MNHCIFCKFQEFTKEVSLEVFIAEDFIIKDLKLLSIPVALTWNS